MKNNKITIIDRGQAFDHFLNKLNLHDETIERMIFINQILFVDLGYACCIEFHGVNGTIKADDYTSWNCHSIKASQEI